MASKTGDGSADQLRLAVRNERAAGLTERDYLSVSL